MVFVTAAIYEPPAPQLPHVVVFFDNDGDVRAIRAVDSRSAGLAVLEKMAETFAALGLPEFRALTENAPDLTT
jgi:hypothetical protein